MQIATLHVRSACFILSDQSTPTALSENIVTGRPFNIAGLRVWQRLALCQGQFTAGDLRLRTVTPQPRLTSVYVHHGRQFLGDMKFYLDDNGDWYLAYLNYGSFSQRSANCKPE